MEYLQDYVDPIEMLNEKNVARIRLKSQEEEYVILPYFHHFFRVMISGSIY